MPSLSLDQYVAGYQIIKQFHNRSLNTYKARHIEFEKMVLLTQLPTQIKRDEEAFKRLKRDFDEVSNINHPHIAHISELLEWEGELYVVCQCDDGWDLQEHLDSKQVMNAAVATEVVRQAASGLQALANHKLSHGGICPENLLWNVHGTLKILNAGLSEVYFAESIDLDDLPEIRDHGAQSDIYRLGQTFLYLLTGQMYSPKNLLEFHQQIKIGEMQTDSPMLSFPVAKPLQDVLRQMLAENPEARYQRAEDVCNDLTQILDDNRNTISNANRAALCGAVVVLGLPLLAVLLAFIVTLFSKPALPAPSKQNELSHAVWAPAGSDGQWWMEDENTYQFLPPLRKQFVSVIESSEIDSARKSGIPAKLWRDLSILYLNEHKNVTEKYKETLDDLSLEIREPYSFLERLQSNIKKLENQLKLKANPSASELHLLANLLHFHAMRQPKPKSEGLAMDEYKARFQVADKAYVTALAAYNWFEIDIRAACHSDRGFLLEAGQDNAGALREWKYARSLLGDGRYLDTNEDQNDGKSEESRLKTPQPLIVALLCQEANLLRHNGNWTEAGDRLKYALDRVSNGPPHLQAYVQERQGWFLMDRWHILEAKKCFQEAAKLRNAQSTFKSSELNRKLKKCDDSKLFNYNDYLNKSEFTYSDHFVFHNLHGIAMTQRYSGNTLCASHLYDQIILSIKRHLTSRREIDNKELYHSFQQRLLNTLERRADCALYNHPTQGNAVDLIAHVLDYNEEYELLQERDWKRLARLLYKQALALALEAQTLQSTNFQEAQTKLQEANSTFELVDKDVLTLEMHKPQLLFMRNLVHACIRQIQENLQLPKNKPATHPLHTFLFGYVKTYTSTNSSQNVDLFTAVQKEWIILDKKNLINRDELDLLLLAVRLLPVGEKRHMDALLTIKLARVPQIERMEKKDEKSKLNPTLGYLSHAYASALRLVLEEATQSKNSSTNATLQLENMQMVADIMHEAAVGYENLEKINQTEDHRIKVTELPKNSSVDLNAKSEFDKICRLLACGKISKVELKQCTGTNRVSKTAQPLVLEISLTSCAKKNENVLEAPRP